MNAQAIKKKNTCQERGIRLQIVRGMLRMTLLEFAKLCAVAKSTLIHWEHGHFSGLTEKGAKKIIHALTNQPIICQLDWLLHGRGMPPTILSDNEQIAKYQLSLFNLATDVDKETLFRSEIDRFQTFTPNAITMQIQDDSAQPFYMHGDCVGGQRVCGNNLKKLLNNICIIQVSNNQLLLRELLIDDKDVSKFKLCCLNPQTKSVKPILIGVEVISAAPVTRLWRPYSNS